MSSYDSFLAHELARHHAALDRAERLADERRERLPDTLQADIEEEIWRLRRTPKRAAG
jgi:hypothetical protein